MARAGCGTRRRQERPAASPPSSAHEAAVARAWRRARSTVNSLAYVPDDSRRTTISRSQGRRSLRRTYITTSATGDGIDASLEEVSNREKRADSEPDLPTEDHRQAHWGACQLSCGGIEERGGRSRSLGDIYRGRAEQLDAWGGPLWVRGAAGHAPRACRPATEPACARISDGEHGLDERAGIAATDHAVITPT